MCVCVCVCVCVYLYLYINDGRQTYILKFICAQQIVSCKPTLLRYDRLIICNIVYRLLKSIYMYK